MKKIVIPLVLVLAFMASSSVLAQSCDAFEASYRSAVQNTLLNTVTESDTAADLLEQLSPNGSLPLGISGSFNHLEGMDMTYAADGSPRFIRRAVGWNVLGSGVNSVVNAIAVSGSDVYVGGYFATAGGSPANRIAKWDGSSWSALGSGVNSVVNAIVVSGSDVYVGGAFSAAGGSPAEHIAKWDGSSWSTLGSGTDGYVYALAVSGSDVYVGGFFMMAGGSLAEHIAKWDGSSWSALGSGTNDTVYALAISGSDVYVGGSFTTAGGNPANRIAKWDGSAWSALGSGLGGAVSTMAISGSDVYVGGSFTTAGGSPANYIAKWDGSAWSALGSGLGDTVSTMAVSGNDVYVGGGFTTAGGNPANYIAKWNGSAWSALGDGVNSTALAARLSSNGLYVGGSFTTAGGNPAKFVAFWEDPTLPISLVSATTTVEAQSATLHWTTAQEINNDRFVIEQQTPQGWKPVGEVAGQGNSMEQHNYTFTIQNLPYGTHTFRIAQYDRNGGVNYSRPISAFVELLEAFALSDAYPNPFNPSTSFTLAVAQTQHVQIKVYDLQGREIATLHNGTLDGQTTHLFRFDAQSMSSGRYLVRVQGEQFTANKQVVLAK